MITGNKEHIAYDVLSGTGSPETVPTVLFFKITRLKALYCCYEYSLTLRY